MKCLLYPQHILPSKTTAPKSTVTKSLDSIGNLPRSSTECKDTQGNGHWPLGGVEAAERSEPGAVNAQDSWAWPSGQINDQSLHRSPRSLFNAVWISVARFLPSDSFVQLEILEWLMEFVLHVSCGDYPTNYIASFLLSSRNNQDTSIWWST